MHNRFALCGSRYPREIPPSTSFAGTLRRGTLKKFIETMNGELVLAGGETEDAA